MARYTVTTKSFFTARSIMAMVDWIDGGNEDIIGEALYSIHYFLDEIVPPYVDDDGTYGDTPPPPYLSRDRVLRKSTEKLRRVDAEKVRSFIAKLRRTADDMEFMLDC
jgi:hypothetical protein